MAKQIDFHAYAGDEGMVKQINCHAYARDEGMAKQIDCRSKSSIKKFLQLEIYYSCVDSSFAHHFH